MNDSVEKVREHHDKIKLIYVLGWGHSGSTLIDKIIGSSKKVFSLGEFIFLDFYAKRIQHTKVLRPFVCTCEQEFSDCRYWGAVKECVELSSRRVVYDESHRDRLAWVARYVWAILTGRKTRSNEETLGDDEDILRCALLNAPPGTKYLLDSSKDFARFARLKLMRDVEVFPVFLIRDVRAVAHSYVKRERQALGLNRMSYLGAAIRWVFVNTMSQILLWVSRSTYVRVSYDQFCTDPGRVVSHLNMTMGLDISPDHFVEDVNSTEYHNVGGNLVRFKPLKEIRADRSWKDKRQVKTKLVGFFFWPLNWFWVYRHR